ncbi:Integrin alpha-3 [Thelohanellus kitauei]|uniref:Integrin alpha-3 n=1 Tax=Thelohanellus kitauei TaxID=669202 RepID=A0A0C2JWJ2_THEKT|nr:Integrin alpha-3 [Thelohanellus kitauei]
MFDSSAKWIPTIGFAIGQLFPTNPESLVVATNDDPEQRGTLLFYDLPSTEGSIKDKQIISDPQWEPFSNFGNKIVIVDINNDNFNDLLVTSPTSKWLDLPEVGHVHLFMNTKSGKFLTNSSIIIHGIPVAHSFFGWNAEAVGDLDGDGVNDFLIAALKLSKDDLLGGVYVYLGGDDGVIRQLTYHEIIKPRLSLNNELTGFGFFLSSKMVLDEQGNNCNDCNNRYYDVTCFQWRSGCLHANEQRSC